jgi:hypothetical protein
VGVEFSFTVSKNGGVRYTIRIGSLSKTPAITAGEYTLSVTDVLKTKIAATISASIEPAALSQTTSTSETLSGLHALPDVIDLYHIDNGPIATLPSSFDPVPTGRQHWSIFQSKKQLPI